MAEYKNGGRVLKMWNNFKVMFLKVELWILLSSSAVQKIQRISVRSPENWYWMSVIFRSWRVTALKTGVIPSWTSMHLGGRGGGYRNTSIHQKRCCFLWAKNNQRKSEKLLCGQIIQSSCRIKRRETIHLVYKSASMMVIRCIGACGVAHLERLNGVYISNRRAYASSRWCLSGSWIFHWGDANMRASQQKRSHDELTRTSPDCSPTFGTWNEK